MRRIARVDENQKQITAALRKIGASVQPMHTLGRGVPDLLVGYRGANYILEVKDGSKPPSKRKLTDDESAWHSNWRGLVLTVESVDEAIRAITQIGAKTGGFRGWKII